MKHSLLTANLSDNSHQMRELSFRRRVSSLATPTKKTPASPMQRPFALSLTVGALLYAALSVLTLVVLHDAGSNGQAMSAGYGVTASRE
jgi:hypothetical protein